MNIAIIPARGMSKRIPGKNMRVLNGYPLIHYTIQAAKKSPWVDHIFVSTEDKEIANYARNSDVGVIDRPAGLATDEVQLEPVIYHAYVMASREIRNSNYLSDTISNTTSSITVLQPTSPLRDDTDINEAVCMFNMQRPDSVVGVTQSHEYYFSGRVDGDLLYTPDYDMQNRKRTQELNYKFVDNGSIYVLSPEQVNKQCRIGKRTIAYIMKKSHSIDIDSIDDFEMAKCFMIKLSKESE